MARETGLDFDLTDDEVQRFRDTPLGEDPQLDRLRMVKMGELARAMGAAMERLSASPPAPADAKPRPPADPIEADTVGADAEDAETEAAGPTPAGDAAPEPVAAPPPRPASPLPGLADPAPAPAPAAPSVPVSRGAAPSPERTPPSPPAPLAAGPTEIAFDDDFDDMDHTVELGGTLDANAAFVSPFANAPVTPFDERSAPRPAPRRGDNSATPFQPRPATHHREAGPLTVYASVVALKEIVGDEGLAWTKLGLKPEQAAEVLRVSHAQLQEPGARESFAAAVEHYRRWYRDNPDWSGTP